MKLMNPAVCGCAPRCRSVCPLAAVPSAGSDGGWQRCQQRRPQPSHLPSITCWQRGAAGTGILRGAACGCGCRAPEDTEGTELLPLGPGSSGPSYPQGPGSSLGLAAPRARGKAAPARARRWYDANARSGYLLQPAQVPRCLSVCRSSLLSAGGQTDVCLPYFSTCPLSGECWSQNVGNCSSLVHLQALELSHCQARQEGSVCSRVCG